MLMEKIRLASRVGYLRVFGARSNVRADYDSASKTYDSYYSRNLAQASLPYIEKVPVAPENAVLDLACGTGFFTHILAERIGPGGKVVAVDISTGMIDCNRREAARKKLCNIVFVEGDAISALRETPNGSVDLINIGWGICYMDHKILRAEILRVLKPGGHLSIIENRASTLREVGDLFERALVDHPGALCKHVAISLPRGSAYLEKAFVGNSSLSLIDCYEGSVDVECESGAEIAEYMIHSGASSGFLDALKPDRIDAVMTTFVREADERAESGGGLPRVTHEFAVLIARKE